MVGRDPGPGPAAPRLASYLELESPPPREQDLARKTREHPATPARTLGEESPLRPARN
ncbi:hypothetical protein AKJ09_04976 [Labilithrix luteola]|uniref:Uncharacterized protein n=1 Tax=Labilithrix luteola TaxID=1391654 RepID=A0A0K1PXS8_9BACT|nr:hypothetical protein AKJ09_04976 [Labilithrix luteola]